VLLRSDGVAVACGSWGGRESKIPPLKGHHTYTQVAAGRYHTVLLGSDGKVRAFGDNETGECEIPSLQSWREMMTREKACLHYVADAEPITLEKPSLILQACFSHDADGVLMHFMKLSGHEQCWLRVLATDQLSNIQARLERELGKLDIVLASGQLLSHVTLNNSSATLGPFFESHC